MTDSILSKAVKAMVSASCAACVRAGAIARALKPGSQPAAGRKRQMLLLAKREGRAIGADRDGGGGSRLV